MLLTPQRMLDETYPARAESVGLARDDVVGFASREGATEGQLQRIRLAVSEAATNAVRHAYPEGSGAFHVTATAVEGELWVLVTDDGCGHQAPPANPGLGWGLALIAHVSQEFILAERSEGGTEARMRFPIGAPEELGS
jgi:anti-sigma regulatory factor (Ser/Thr protein kinase)